VPQRRAAATSSTCCCGPAAAVIASRCPSVHVCCCCCFLHLQQQPKFTQQPLADQHQSLSGPAAFPRPNLGCIYASGSQSLTVADDSLIISWDICIIDFDTNVSLHPPGCLAGIQLLQRYGATSRVQQTCVPPHPLAAAAILTPQTFEVTRMHDMQ
jgi:hypothetical protein